MAEKEAEADVANEEKSGSKGSGCVSWRGRGPTNPGPRSARHVRLQETPDAMQPRREGLQAAADGASGRE